MRFFSSKYNLVHYNRLEKRCKDNPQLSNPD